MEFINLIILLLISLVTSIFFVKYIKGCTFDQSTKYCICFIKNIIHEFVSSPEPLKPDYPVFIGDNGNGIIYKNVDKSFKELNNYFDVIYFTGFKILPNRIIYRFKIGNLKSSMDYIDLLELLEVITEKILSKHISNQGYPIPFLDGFVSAKIDSNNYLYIAIAKNDNGLKENHTLHEKIKDDYFSHKHINKKKELLTDWKDE